MISSQLAIVLDAQCLHIEIGKAFSRHIVPFVTSKGGKGRIFMEVEAFSDLISYCHGNPGVPPLPPRK